MDDHYSSCECHIRDLNPRACRYFQDQEGETIMLLVVSLELKWLWNLTIGLLKNCLWSGLSKPILGSHMTSRL